jgi:hypothetical protein
MCGMDLSVSEQWSVAGSCEHEKESSGPRGVFLD